MARRKARSFFKQCKDYVRGITRARKKKLLDKLLEKEQKEKKRKVQAKAFFEDKPLKELKRQEEAGKCNSEENKPEDKPLKELKTEKCKSGEEFVDNELKNQEDNSEGHNTKIQLWCEHCNYSYCKCRPSYRNSDGYCPECGYYKCRKKR